MTFAVNTLNNALGAVQSAADLQLNVLANLNNAQGKISAAGALGLRGAAEDNAAGTLDNRGGQLLAGAGLSVHAAGVDNQQQGLIYSQKALRLALSGVLDNRTGKLQSGEAAEIRAASLDNRGGAIAGQQLLTLQLLTVLNNEGGTLRSNGDQQLAAAQIRNQQGTVASLGGLTLSAAALNNRDGTLVAQGDSRYAVAQLDNRQGKLHSGGALLLNSEAIVNQGGQLVAAGDLTLRTAALDNSEGTVSSQQALAVTATQLHNRDGGRLIGTRDVAIAADTLDNRAGRLQSAGTLSLSLGDALDNRGGQVLANGALSLDAPDSAVRAAAGISLLNAGGTVQSGSTLTLRARHLDNQRGTLLSQQAMTLTLGEDYTHRAGDTLSSNRALTLSVAGVLTNLTDWLLPGSVSFTSRHFSNAGRLVGNTLRLTTGSLNNRGRLEGDTLTLSADSLDNRGAIMGDDLRLTLRQLDNQGSEAVIAASDALHIRTAQRLSNLQGALIYSAGALQLHSDDRIENRASSIEADGDVTLQAKRFDNLREGLEIARDAESSSYQWHRYNYYWRSYGHDTNTDPSTMTPTTQTLTFQNDAAAQENRYGTLLAIDAAGKRAQVRVKNNQGQLVDLWVNYLGLTPGANGSYAMTFYETRGFRQHAVPTPYHNTVWREAGTGIIEQWNPDKHIDIASAPLVTDYSNLRERTASGTVTRDKLVSAGVGAQLLAGGSLVMHIGESLLNDASTLSANGDLTLDGRGTVENKGYSVNERRDETFVDHYDQDTVHWYPTQHNVQTVALATVDGIISGHGNVSVRGTRIENTTVNQAQVSRAEAALSAAEAERVEWQRNPLAVSVAGGAVDPGSTQLSPGKQPGAVAIDPQDPIGRPLLPAELALTEQQHLPGVATAIPNNALFRQHTAPGSPFLVVTDERFTSRSQFISSDYLLQRVGYDPAQVHKRLGDGFYEQRRVREQILQLTGRPSIHGEDAMAQYQALMNNAVKVAQDFQLVPGVALSPAQIAALQQDIVWMVSETVNTASGPQTVWVPKVYLASQTLRLGGDGALIAGGQLSLSAESVSNAANLFADQALRIDAGTFSQQGGVIQADTLGVQADSLTISTHLQEALRQATMRAGDISLSGGDVRLQGAKLDAGNDLSLSARHNLEIGMAKSQFSGSTALISGAMGNRNSRVLEEPGQRMAQISGEWQQALGSLLNAGGNLSLRAGQDIRLQGSQAAAGGQLGVQAGGNLSLTADKTTNTSHLEAGSRTTSVSNSRREEQLQLTTLSGQQGVTLLAGQQLLAEGAQVDSRAGAVGISAGEVMLKEAHQAVSDSDSERHRGRKSSSRREMETQRDGVVGSTLSGEQGVTVLARDGNLTVTASTLHSEQGAVALQAKNDVTLNTASETTSQFIEKHASKKKFLSKSSSHSVQHDRTTVERGSLLSGDSVSVTAGRDLTVSGSAIVGDGDVMLRAGNNVDIVAATESESHFLLEQKKKSGLLSSGGLGFSIGSQSSRHQIDEQGTTQSQSVSTVGSQQGSVTITAGSQLHIGGADLLAGKDLSLSGDGVSIDPGYDWRRRTETFEQKSSGLTLALSGTAGSALNAAVSTAQQARKEGGGRLGALLGAQAALSGVQAGQAAALDSARAEAGSGQGGTNTVGIGASYGSQSSKSETRSESLQAQGSTLTAGQNLSITATGGGSGAGSGDIAVVGGQLKAGGNLSLDAARDISLQSAQNRDSTDGRNSSHGGSLGVGVGVGGGGGGLNVAASVNAGRGHENGSGLTQVETTLDAGSRLSLTSGRDTALQGAQAGGETVTVDAGRHLTLQSRQDSERYDAKQQSASAGGSVAIIGAGGGGGLSASRDKLHSRFDSVREQTGLFAGQGGFDVTVGGHTQLDGAVIGSTAAAERNKLETGTLGWTDIHNEADFRAEHQGAGLSSGGSLSAGAAGSQFLGNLAGGLLAGVNHAGSASSTTQAAVSAGDLVIRDREKQQQAVSGLSRDAANANPGLNPIFNKEQEQSRLRQAQVIGEVGSQVSDIIRTQGDMAGLKAQKDPAALAQAREQLEKSGKPANDAAVMQRAYDNAMREYGTGSALQKAAQAVTGALTALAGNNLAGALASGASPYLATEIKRRVGEDNAAANAMAHAVLGALTAELNNQSGVAGGVGAGGGELAARYIAGELFPGRTAEQLSESEKRQVSALSQLAAGLAGGLATGDTAGAVTGGLAGKNAVENNFLGATSSDRLDKAIEKIKSGDKFLAAANDLIKLENADKRSDALMSKFTKDPSQMNSTERAELAGYLRIYAAEMEKEYGQAVSQELVKGLLSGQAYIKRNPDSAAMAKAQTIMNTWATINRMPALATRPCCSAVMCWAPR